MTASQRTRPVAAAPTLCHPPHPENAATAISAGYRAHPGRADPTPDPKETPMTDPTPRQILDLELGDNDSGATTARGYLVALLRELWREADGFSAKRPFGNSDWPYDLYKPMVRAGYIRGSFDEDGYVEDCDWKTADRLVLAAIETLGTETTR